VNAILLKFVLSHYISFDEARTVFYDENAIQFFDPDHSDDEDRFILLGISFKLDEENEYWRCRK